jgi:uncharacterized protein (DUF433 family)
MNAPHHPRIAINPGVCGGEPTVRGTHFAVADILRLLEDGDSEETLVADFPPLTLVDVRACRAYAAATGLARGEGTGSTGSRERWTRISRAAHSKRVSFVAKRFIMAPRSGT